MKVKINVNNGSISAARVAAACGGRLIGDGSAEIGFVCTDSREVSPGTMFAAIVGERVDGHDYIGAAVVSGAAAVLAERIPDGAELPVQDADDL